MQRINSTCGYIQLICVSQLLSEHLWDWEEEHLFHSEVLVSHFPNIRVEHWNMSRNLNIDRLVADSVGEGVLKSGMSTAYIYCIEQVVDVTHQPSALRVICLLSHFILA